MTSQPNGLKRALGPVLLTLYGVGVTVGAGIYVLVGEVAGIAGLAAPMAFLLSGVIAGLSALSYAELAVLFPKAGGEAAYVNAAFARHWLTTLVGLLVVVTGITSAATVLLGFVGYLNELIAVPKAVALICVVAGLAAVTFWGVAESLTIVAFTTVLEVGGLVLVIGGGLPSLAALPAALPDMLPGFEASIWLAVVSSSVLAFFAFIGFEDIVNMAEEVRQPSRTLPLAIVLTLIVSVLLYMLLAVTAVLTVPPNVLAQSDAPLALVFARSGGNPELLSGIAALAVVNGALIQIIMASRLIYGMARLGRLPAVFGHVNAITRTPDYAIICISAIVLICALTLPITDLAAYASLAVLLVFTIVNVALLKLRGTVPRDRPRFSVPLLIPVAGALASFALFAFGLGREVGLFGY